MKKIIDGYFSFLKIVLTLLMGILIIPVTMQILPAIAILSHAISGPKSCHDFASSGSSLLGQ